MSSFSVRLINVCDPSLFSLPFAAHGQALFLIDRPRPFSSPAEDLLERCDRLTSSLGHAVRFRSFCEILLHRRIFRSVNAGLLERKGASRTLSFPARRLAHLACSRGAGAGSFLNLSWCLSADGNRRHPIASAALVSSCAFTMAFDQGSLTLLWTSPLPDSAICRSPGSSSFSSHFQVASITGSVTFPARSQIRRIPPSVRPPLQLLLFFSIHSSP